jgi:hypothetical protein
MSSYLSYQSLTNQKAWKNVIVFLKDLLIHIIFENCTISQIMRHLTMHLCYSLIEYEVVHGDPHRPQGLFLFLFRMKFLSPNFMNIRWCFFFGGFLKITYKSSWAHKAWISCLDLQVWARICVVEGGIDSKLQVAQGWSSFSKPGTFNITFWVYLENTSLGMFILLD